MGLFNRKKNPVWRNSQGKIECPGDNCPKECDDSCPIWLNTQASMLLTFGDQDSARKKLKEMLAIAPDYYDGWNNMAAIYGQKGEYSKAKECYEKAHQLEPMRSAPVFGLALVYKDLGNKEESLKWCDEYEKLENDGKTKSIRKHFSKNNDIAFSRVKAVKQSVHIVMKLLEKGREFGIIVSDNFANIPEIMDQARPVCFDLLSGFKEEKSSQAANPIVQMTWAAYAGIGAVYQWNEDWETLSKKGIYKTLTEERGLYAMDEYIMDFIGMPYDSADEKAFRNQLINIGYIAIAEAAKYKNEGITDFVSGMMAMYDFGMVYEMNRLGMY